MVMVCAHFLAQHGKLKVDMGGIPVVHHRSLGLTLMPRSQNLVIPQYTLEGGEVSGGVAV
jgi:hypothetical protein